MAVQGLDRMPPGCNDLCAWRCSKSDCGHEWEIELSTRTLAGRGCKECGHRKTGADNSRPGPGESLAEVNPALAAQLVEVVDHPRWTAWDLLPNSNKSC
ncbi:zinc-ribbon domain-containing protein [Nonomuraea maheshkhaliensis]|uniref:zinc-ribbon domain-containing protein n=1 Tax=Nonomuraea maheshkhaliensis TaxID=419590 RepID=UPI003D159B31